jgi:hypothetical protein
VATAKEAVPLLTAGELISARARLGMDLHARGVDVRRGGRQVSAGTEDGEGIGARGGARADEE